MPLAPRRRAKAPMAGASSVSQQSSTARVIRFEDGSSASIDEAFLESNPQFSAMLQALEQHDAKLVTGNSTTSYEAAFFTSLRTMLRECMFSQDDLQRAMHIKRVHSWFLEKRSKSPGAGMQMYGQQIATAVQQAASPRRSTPHSPSPHVKQPSKPRPPIVSPTRNNGGNTDRRTKIVQKQLEQTMPTSPYIQAEQSRESSPERDPSADIAAELAAASPPSSPEPVIQLQPSTTRAEPSATTLTSGVYAATPTVAKSSSTAAGRSNHLGAAGAMAHSQEMMPSLRQRNGASDRLKNYKLRDLEASRDRREGRPPSARPRTASDEQAQPSSASKTGNGLYYEGATSDAEKAMQEMWMAKRRLEEVERSGEQELDRALNEWARRRARVEEEVARRQEASRFTSRTADLYSRPPSTMSSSSRPGTGRRPTSARPGSARPGSARPTVYDDLGIIEDDGDSDNDIEIIDVVSSSRQEKPTTASASSNRLRSPYPDGIRPLSSRPASSRPSSRPSQPPSSRFLDGTLSPYKGTARYLSESETEDEENAQDDDTLHGFTSPFVGGTLDASTRPATASGWGTQRPSSNMRPVSAPASRVKQLTEVEHIKRQFARHRIPCSFSTLERALTVPEDRSYAECLSALPMPGSHIRVKDPNQKEKKAKKGKKGAKKGGKKKKKK